MSANKAQDVIHDRRTMIVNKIMKDMENDGLNWIAPFASTGRPHNPVSGTIYQGANRLHLAYAGIEAGFADPRWVTFKQAKENGWHLHKGATSAIVEKWKEMPLIQEDEETGEKTIIGHYMRPVGYFNVFNAEQIDGIPPLENPSHEEDHTATISDILIESSRCPIQHGALPQGYGGYAPVSDKIIMAPRTMYRSDEAYLRTLLHEMTHSTGHASALNRDVLNTFGTPKYAFEELIAELGALFTATDLGIQATDYDDAFYNNHVAYLRSWITVLQKDPDQLFQAASKAEKATTYIINRYTYTHDQFTREKDTPSLSAIAQETRHASDKLGQEQPTPVKQTQER